MSNFDKKPLVSLDDTRKKELTARVSGHMSFSFEFFKEIDYFGIGDCDTKWFSSLFEAINVYSSMDLSKLPRNKTTRYHEINWEQKNIPIKFEDLDWLPKNEQILVSPNEIFQLNITKGSGRIIGFIIANIFYIVLLDPKHNLQPSKDYNYKVDPTSISETQYEEVKSKFDKLFEWTRDQLTEQQKNELTLSRPQMHVIFTYMSDKDYQEYKQFCTDTSIKDLIFNYSYQVLTGQTSK